MTVGPERSRARAGRDPGAEPPNESLFRFMRTAEKIADEMRAVTLGLFRNSPKITVKKDGSPVTRADKDAEQVARKIISARHPGHGFLGEEFGHTKGREFVWVVDPIDGTRSFVSGCPTFGTLIALTEDGIPRVGVVDLPALDERWVACDGSGAIHKARKRSRRVAAAKTAKLGQATSATTAMLDRPDRMNPRTRRLLDACKSHRIGGDSLNYGLVASGHLDIALDIDMKPFDFLALVPVVREAGGRITDWKGKELTIDSGEQVVASANPTLHAQALAALGK